MRKKTVIMVSLIGLAVMSFVGCGGTPAKNTASNNNGKNTATTTVAQTEKKPEGKLGDYVVTVKSHKIIKDYSGKPALKVVADFTNNSDKGASYLVDIVDKAFQNGVQLETAFVDGGSKNIDKEIKPGATIEVEMNFLLADKETPVQLEISEFLSFSDEKIEKTLNLK